MKRTESAKVQEAFLHLRTDLHLTRKIWHMGMGLLMVLVYMAGMPKNLGILILGFCLAFDLLFETLRLKNPVLNQKVMRVWAPIMRSCEVNRLSGIPFYLAAAILSVAIFPKPVAILSILFLAFGDPIASLMGVLYGHKSLRFANGKSLIGTLAGVMTCFLVSIFFLPTLGLPLSSVLALSLVGAIAGGTAELLPLEVDDNFSIPMISGFTLWLAFILMGI